MLTELLPTDGKMLVKMLHQHGVLFKAQGAGGWRSLVVLLLPFAYLGICGWMLHRATNDLMPGGGGVGQCEVDGVDELLPICVSQLAIVDEGPEPDTRYRSDQHAELNTHQRIVAE